ncbi:MAG: hypothetical protein EON94_04360 [Caulobacteraceae bacterium]|nr:MAG: hypothetical protein EON94_04360 [Caulobacteraceae bacterium]
MAKFILPLLLLTGVLAGCGSSSEGETGATAPTTAGGPPPEAKVGQGTQTSPSEANARASAATKGGN